MDRHTKIIAEIGVNYNGSMEIAKRMVDEIARCGVDVAKFQTAVPENLVSRFAQKADYQKETTGGEESQLEMIRKIMLPLEAFAEVKAYCEKAGVEFLSTPFDLESIDYLDSLGMRLWKIPSGEVTNLPYLIKIARTGYPVIMSTGMCTLTEISEAVDVLNHYGAGDLTILHCTTEYPAPKDEVNLRAMDTLRETFGVPIGYSDHTEGIEVSLAAVARGATVIEKHFTLDKNMEGPDHKASTEPAEFRQMVQSIRNIERALGQGGKTVSPSEARNMTAARKSIVAARKITQGEVFTEDNLTTKRPGDGISPMRWFEVIGQKAPKDFEQDEKVVL
ncbi:N-acetylneuraminate synthase [Eubacterium sp. AB3007]|uniref:N-acetylneuraminate synthase n=1 Tax=Eubacterium sp. AB3007 TaxID=1392487 RepID=UPI0004865536|nr:N-acetylneuraminate synthase [Eubacterium sp. AB3007]